MLEIDHNESNAYEAQGQIPLLYKFRTRKDKFPDGRYKYEDNILIKSTSTFIWRNPIMNTYLRALTRMCSHLVNSVADLRNLYSPGNKKYYNNYID